MLSKKPNNLSWDCVKIKGVKVNWLYNTLYTVPIESAKNSGPKQSVVDVTFEDDIQLKTSSLAALWIHSEIPDTVHAC